MKQSTICNHQGNLWSVDHRYSCFSSSFKSMAVHRCSFDKKKCHGNSRLYETTTVTIMFYHGKSHLYETSIILFYLVVNKNSFIKCSNKGWCRCNRQKDNCWHVWRVGRPRGRGVLRKGLLQSGPFRWICCQMGGEVSCQSWSVQTCAGSGRWRWHMLSYHCRLELNYSI